MIYIPVPRWLVGLVGRAFFRTVRVWPFAFPMLVAVGIGVCGLVVFTEPELDRTRFWIAKVFGVVGLIFYGWLLCLFTWKWINDRWDDFCIWGFSLFENM